MTAYLSPSTFVAKVLSLICALAGGLHIGREGPAVHYSGMIAHIVCELPIIRPILANQNVLRQVLGAACAAGVSGTFGAPIGGVLYSIEVRPGHHLLNLLTLTHPSPFISLGHSVILLHVSHVEGILLLHLCCPHMDINENQNILPCANSGSLLIPSS